MPRVLATADRVGYGLSGSEYIRSTASKLSETVSVRDFGAIGDGIANDLLAFRAAVDVAATVCVPEGTYIFEGTERATGDLLLPPGTRLIGQGRNSSRIFRRHAGSGQAVVRVSADCAIEDLTIGNDYQGNEAGWRVVVLEDGASNVLIRGNTIFGPRSYGISVLGKTLADVVIEANYFPESRYGVIFNDSNVQRVRITGNSILNATADCILFNLGSASDVVIANNVLSCQTSDQTNSGFGVDLAGVSGGVVITGNTFRNMRYQALHVEDSSSNVIFANNCCEGASDDGKSLQTEAAFLILNSSGILIANNSFTRFARAGLIGVEVRRPDRPPPSGIVISGNLFKDCGRLLLTGLSGSASHVREDVSAKISGNTFRGSWERIVDNLSFSGVEFSGNTLSASVGNSDSAVCVLPACGGVVLRQNSYRGFAGREVGVERGSRLFQSDLYGILEVTSIRELSDLQRSPIVLFSIGKWAQGVLHVILQFGSDVRFGARGAFKLSWDGVRLEDLLVSSESSDRIGEISLMADDQNLKVFTKNSNLGLESELTGYISFEFIGHIFY